MAYKTFAAIDIGSYELAMKIYEISAKRGMKEIDSIRHRIELGTDSYFSGKLSLERVDELCRMLREFTMIMKTYKVDEYRAYGTSAIRETENTLILLDQIQMRTGIKIEILSNSEQRFLDYKSVASKGETFKDIIEEGTAIVDIGGGSIQISLFDNDKLITTQNMRPGVLRMREELSNIQYHSKHLDGMVSQLIDEQLQNFKRMFMEERRIKNVILVDDYVSMILQKTRDKQEIPGSIDAPSYFDFVNGLSRKTSQQIAEQMGIPEENSSLLYMSALLVKRIVKMFDASLIWAPGVTLCDGMTYEYAEVNRLIKAPHDFEEDILVCARNINKRYMGNMITLANREQYALSMFDSTRKFNGLSKRDRLLLHIACILGDCGKYISLSNVGESSYSIIMATEIIGLSHAEREIVANIVKYAYQPFEYFKNIQNKESIDQASYLKIAKLTAIMKLADGLERGGRKKCRNVKMTLREDEMVIQVETAEDYALEYGLFEQRANFFEEVFSVKPYLKLKKVNS